MILSITRALRVAYEQECKGLTALERGVLWSLAAIADCKWTEPGYVKMTDEALLAELEMEHGVKAVLESLQRKGKIRIVSAEEGRIVLHVCFWYDRFFREREAVRRRVNRFRSKESNVIEKGVL